jgi:hypothetical protein
VALSIAVDLSQEECLYSLQSWLTIAKELRVAHPNLSMPLAVLACKSDLLNLSDGEHLLKARSLQGRLRLLCLKGHPSPPHVSFASAGATLVFCSAGAASTGGPSPSTTSSTTAAAVNIDILRGLWIEMLSSSEGDNATSGPPTVEVKVSPPPPPRLKRLIGGHG